MGGGLGDPAQIMWALAMVFAFLAVFLLGALAVAAIVTMMEFS